MNCPNCKDGGDVFPCIDVDLNWMWKCDSCGWWRFLTCVEFGEMVK